MVSDLPVTAEFPHPLLFESKKGWICVAWVWDREGTKKLVNGKQHSRLVLTNRNERTTSKCTPQFLVGISEKWPHRLPSIRNIRNFLSNGKHPTSGYLFIQWRHKIELSSLTRTFKTVPSVMLSPLIMPNSGSIFWSFFQCRTDELDAVKIRNSARQFCRWNSYWRRLAIKVSHEPKIALQISWRTESESG